MPQISKVSSPVTEEWFFTVIILLFALMVYAFLFSSGWVRDVVRNFFKNKERKSIFASTGVNTLKSKAIMVFFSLMTVSLYLYVLIYSMEYIGASDRAGDFTFGGFVIFALVVCGFYGISYFLKEAVAWVFIDRSRIQTVRSSYTALTALFGCMLFPLLVADVYTEPALVIYVRCAVAVIFAAFSLIYAAKLFQIFFQKKLAFFYIILYLCALEIIPLLLLYKALLVVV